MLTDGAMVSGWVGLSDDLFTYTLLVKSIHITVPLQLIPELPGWLV